MKVSVPPRSSLATQSSRPSSSQRTQELCCLRGGAGAGVGYFYTIKRHLFTVPDPSNASSPLTKPVSSLHLLARGVYSSPARATAQGVSGPLHARTANQDESLGLAWLCCSQLCDSFPKPPTQSLVLATLQDLTSLSKKSAASKAAWRGPPSFLLLPTFAAQRWPENFTSRGGKVVEAAFQQIPAGEEGKTSHLSTQSSGLVCGGVSLPASPPSKGSSLTCTYPAALGAWT